MPAKIRQTNGDKDKGKYVPVQAMNACRGSRGIAPSIPNVGNEWK